MDTPSIKRRLIAMVYETFLLLAVEMLAVAVWLLATGNRHGPAFDHGLKVFLFSVTGAYFIHAWTGSGHTLAMKTWRMSIVTGSGARVSRRTALLRYLLAWGWFLPALAACALLGLKSKGQIALALALGILGWGLTAFLDKDRQFLHDRLAGTRLRSLPKVRPATAAPSKL
jgi:uncharacterized RDD family membrane protein YckC